MVGACHPALGVDGDARAWMVSPGTWALGFWPQAEVQEDR